MITEKVYKNTDYRNSLSFEEDGDEQAINALTRVVIKIGPGDIIIDSNTASSGAFDWTTYGLTGRLDLKLGHEKQIKAMKVGKYKALVIVYDATYPNGLPWDTFTMEVI